ncbi:hypothetical protein BC828DRAFT_409974 [Blastocladiella britannica]|nr:hypothetical protein BC828DRAFT_409974 [Blastocladiella britannica]
MMAPHPARELSCLNDDTEIVIIPLGFWADETNANLSKTFSHVETAAYKIASIDGALGRLQLNAQFIAATKGATCLEIGEAVVADANRTLANGVLWVNPHGKKVVLVGVVAYIMGDGPKLSLMSSHRHRHRKNCRVCLHDKHKSMDNAPFGQPRTPEATSEVIKEYINCADEIEVMQRDPALTAAAKQSAAKKITSRYDAAANGISPGFNPFLALPRLDVHQDTVTDNLHFGPLGHNKYMWEYVKMLGFSLSDNVGAVEEFMSSMDGSSYATMPTGKAIAKHYKAMAGADLKTIIQFMPFLLAAVLPTMPKSLRAEDITEHVENRRLILVLAMYTAALNKLLYLSSIEDKDKYLERVDTISTSLYTVIRGNGVLWNKKGRNSVKVHQLVHLPDHVRFHGGFVDKSTEVFESSNRPVRVAINGTTNRLNTDRDVARVMAYKTGMGYIGAGGQWLDEGGNAQHASRQLQALFQDKDRG